MGLFSFEPFCQQKPAVLDFIRLYRRVRSIYSCRFNDSSSCVGTFTETETIKRNSEEKNRANTKLTEEQTLLTFLLLVTTYISSGN